jgi:hypothetical protein
MADQDRDSGSPDVAEDDGLLDPQDSLDNRDALDEGYSPPERPYAVDGWGTTAAEAATGESLDARLRRELPDGVLDEGDGIGDASDTDGEPLDREVGTVRAGRLADQGEEFFTTDVGIDGGAASAEEAAVHVVDGKWDAIEDDDAAAEFLRERG